MAARIGALSDASHADILVGGRSEASRRLRFGWCALAIVLLFVFGSFPLLWLLGRAPDTSAWQVWNDPYLRGVVGFTIFQAILSTLLSLLAGTALGLALHRSRLPGRGLILRLFFLPQALPVLVGALGLVTVFGRNGVVADILVGLGLPRPSIYGLGGILVAHVFFNMPLVARFVFGGLSAVPSESWKLAGQLSLSPMAVFRLVEWPALRKVLPGAAGLVFMLCFTSFTLVLVLGGGPAATTLQVAIYQSLRYDFDPDRALVLSLVQILLVAVLLLPTLARTGRDATGFGLGAAARRFDRPSPLGRVFEGAVLALGLVFVAAPFLAVFVAGARADFAKLLGDPAFHRAALTSSGIAVAATAIGLLLSLALVLGAGASRRAGTWLRLLPSLVLVVPPVVIGAGWFLVLRQFGDVARFAVPIVVLVNAMLVLPFATRILAPEAEAAARARGRLASSLGLRGWARFRHVEAPALRAPVALAASLGLALTLGDLGAVALFGNADLVTLPTLLLQRMGSYRSTDAEGLALLLGLVCMALILVAERGVGTGRRA